MSKFDLIDIWRDRNPNSLNFTWHSTIDKAIHCRLDWFLFSKHLHYLVHDNYTQSLFRSDHDIVILNLLASYDRGRGFWKFNVSLLNDTKYVELVKNTITNVINSYSNLNASLLWEAVKMQVREVSIHYSKRKARDRLRCERELLSSTSQLEEICAFHATNDNLNTLKKCKAELDELYDYKLRGIFIRSRARWIESGEKSTRYFLNLERRNKTANSVTKLKNDNDIVLTEKDSILNELYMFYSNLYAKRAVHDPSIFINNLSNFVPISDMHAGTV